jgi:hypothetical protein
VAAERHRSNHPDPETRHDWMTLAKLWPVESVASARIAVRGDKVGRLALETDVGGKRRLVVPPKAPSAESPPRPRAGWPHSCARPATAPRPDAAGLPSDTPLGPGGNWLRSGALDHQPDVSSLNRNADIYGIRAPNSRRACDLTPESFTRDPRAIAADGPPTLARLPHLRRSARASAGSASRPAA